MLTNLFFSWEDTPLPCCMPQGRGSISQRQKSPSPCITKHKYLINKWTLSASRIGKGLAYISGLSQLSLYQGSSTSLCVLCMSCVWPGDAGVVRSIEPATSFQSGQQHQHHLFALQYLKIKLSPYENDWERVHSLWIASLWSSHREESCAKLLQLSNKVCA